VQTVKRKKTRWEKCAKPLWYVPNEKCKQILSISLVLIIHLWKRYNWTAITIEYQKRKLSIYQLVINKANVMPAATMFAKLRSGSQNLQNPIDTNPIIQHFEIGKQTACAGPELVWKIHDAYRKNDGKVSVCLCVCVSKFYDIDWDWCAMHDFQFLLDCEKCGKCFDDLPSLPANVEKLEKTKEYKTKNGKINPKHLAKPPLSK
jgi:hypothetical protein